MKIALLIFFIRIINLNCFSNIIPNCQLYDQNTNQCLKCENK